ncbi:MAG: PAS domain-containing protein [Candidatus Latescibacterota bacterium]|nr:MAG: PAS domain-containing protein [Candidatus Latescibacterota bacterium]
MSARRNDVVWWGGATLAAYAVALLAAVFGHTTTAGLAAGMGLCGAAILMLRFDASRRALDHLRLDTESVLRCLVSGLITIDRSGHVTRFNPAAERILGLQPQDLHGRELKDLFATRAPLLFDKLRHSLEEGAPIHRFEVQLSQPDAPPRPIGLSTSLLRAPDGEWHGILATFQDLSEVRRMQERVRRADRLAAVGQLAASIAHEIRNPLAAIANSVDMLREELPVQGEQRRLMDLVVKESERLNHILDDFLEYASSRPLDRQVVPIRAGLEDVVRLMRRHPDIGSEIRIVLQDRTDGTSLACIDSEQMKQVYVNLALNAFEAMEHRGSLRIIVERRSGEELGLPEASFLCLAFQDSGPGVEAGEEAIIFEPFHTTKPQGTGLGLSIAAKIVESHAGRLEAANQPQGGAEFSIYLPEVTGPTDSSVIPDAKRSLESPESETSESDALLDTEVWGLATEETRNAR